MSKEICCDNCVSKNFIGIVPPNCDWYKDNVMLGDKSVNECPYFKPIDNTDIFVTGLTTAEDLNEGQKLNKEIKLESEWLESTEVFPKNTVLAAKSEDGKIISARLADGVNTYKDLQPVEVVERNDFKPDPTFTGEIASIIANGPYSNIIPFETSNWRSKIVGTYNHIKCKACGRSERITLYKDGDGYICKECKKDRGE